MATPSWKSAAQRRKVIDRARELARSGHHPDHASIVAKLEVAESFADARLILEDRAIRAQLDRLCTMAQEQRAG